MNIKGIISQVGFRAKENSAELLLISGTISLVAAGIKIWKARPKFEQIMNDYHSMEDAIEVTLKTVEEKGEIEKYTQEDAKADRLHNKVTTAVKLVELFAPIGFLSIGSLLSFSGATAVYKVRYIGASKAYLGAAKRINFLEKGIVAAYGKEALDKLNGKEQKELVQTKDGSTEEVTTTTKDEETGVLANEALFDSCSRNFEKDPEMNMEFLTGMEETMTRVLLSRTTKSHPGFLFLNEVRAALDLPQTQEGQILGWMNYYDPEDNIKHGSAGFVSFGVNDISRDDINKRFRLGLEPAAWLKFNCDPTPIIGRCGFAVR